MISRRHFLRGTLGSVGVTVGLPILDRFLDGNGTAWAQGGALPLRFGTWFWGLGWPSIGGGSDHFMPSGSGGGSAWSLPTGLAALGSFKDHLTLFTNYSYVAAAGAAHIPSRGISVSASHNPEWVQDSGASGFRNQQMPHPSIDALIQESWGPDLGTPHSSLNLTLGVGTLYAGTSSWNRGGSFRTFQRSPVELFDKVFATLGGTTMQPPLSGPTAEQVKNRYRKSVLDAVTPQLGALSQSLGASDRLRVEAHLQGVREMERRVAALAASSPADAGTPASSGLCAGLSRPQNYSGADQLRLRNQIMADLLVYALSCNLTRLFCYEFTPTQCSGTLPEIGMTSGEGVHDAYSHDDGGPMRGYCEFVIEGLAYLVGKLKATQEGAGSLLDRMLMVATSETGPVHQHTYHPYIFVGKAGGALKGNWHAKRASASNNEGGRVLLTAAHAMAAPLPRLGMPATPITGASSGQTVNYEVTSPVSEVLGS